MTTLARGSKLQKKNLCWQFFSFLRPRIGFDHAVLWGLAGNMQAFTSKAPNWKYVLKVFHHVKKIVYQLPHDNHGQVWYRNHQIHGILKLLIRNTTVSWIHSTTNLLLKIPNRWEYMLKWSIPWCYEIKLSPNLSRKSIIWNQIQILTSRNTMLLNPLNKPRGPYGNKSKIIFENKKK